MIIVWRSEISFQESVIALSIMWIPRTELKIVGMAWQLAPSPREPALNLGLGLLSTKVRILRHGLEIICTCPDECPEEIWAFASLSLHKYLDLGDLS